LTKRLVIAAIVLCIADPIALADTRSFEDPKDAPGRVDIKRVTHGHDDGKLVHRIVGYAKIRRGEEPRLNVYATRYGGIGAAYVVSTSGVRNALGKKTGRVRVRRPGPRTVVYRFDERALANPRSYKWQACVCIDSDEQDLAPNRRVTHNLP
jgi:hypothetical protein